MRRRAAIACLYCVVVLHKEGGIQYAEASEAAGTAHPRGIPPPPPRRSTFGALVDQQAESDDAEGNEAKDPLSLGDARKVDFASTHAGLSMSRVPPPPPPLRVVHEVSSSLDVTPGRANVQPPPPPLTVRTTDLVTPLRKNTEMQQERLVGDPLVVRPPPPPLRPNLASVRSSTNILDEPKRHVASRQEVDRIRPPPLSRQGLSENLEGNPLEKPRREDVTKGEMPETMRRPLLSLEAIESEAPPGDSSFGAGGRVIPPPPPRLVSRIDSERSPRTGGNEVMQKTGNTKLAFESATFQQDVAGSNDRAVNPLSIEPPQILRVEPPPRDGVVRSSVMPSRGSPTTGQLAIENSPSENSSREMESAALVGFEEIERIHRPPGANYARTPRNIMERDTMSRHDDDTSYTLDSLERRIQPSRGFIGRDGTSNDVPLQTGYQSYESNHVHGPGMQGIRDTGSVYSPLPQTTAPGGLNYGGNVVGNRPPLEGQPLPTHIRNDGLRRPPPAAQGSPRAGLPRQSGQPLRRPDPRQMHSRYNAAHIEAAPPPTWKRLWRKIEGSLDGLADLEETLGGKARQLYSSTRDTAASTIGSTPWLKSKSGMEARPTQKNAPQFRPENVVGRKAPEKQESRLPGTRGPPPHAVKQTRKAATPYNPYGAMPAKKTTSEEPADSRKINWNDVVTKKTRRVIRASGGASTPNESSPMSLNTSYPSAQQAQRPPLAPQWKMDGDSKARPPPGQPAANLKQAFPSSQMGAPPQSGRKSVAQSKPVQKPKYLLDDPITWSERIGGLIPSFPKIRLFGRSSSFDYGSTMDAWKAEDESTAGSAGGLFGFLSRRKETDFPLRSQQARLVDSTAPLAKIPKMLVSLGEKCNSSIPFGLLTNGDEVQCRSIGQTRAFLDIAGMILFLSGLRMLPAIRSPLSGLESMTENVDAASLYLGEALATWAPFVFSAAFLSALTSALVFETKAKPLAARNQEVTDKEVRYGSLFLRLTTSHSTPRRIMDKVGAVAHEQVLARVELTRVRCFISTILLIIALAAMAFVQPVLQAIGSALLHIIGLLELHHWPPQWNVLWSTLKSAMAPLVQMIVATLKDGVHSLAENPVRFAYQASIIMSLLAVAILPSMEAQRKPPPGVDEETEEDVNAGSFDRLTSQVSALGTSSATRLALLSGSVETILERWRLAQPPEEGERRGALLGDVARLVGYGILSSGTLAVPLLLYMYAGILPMSPQSQLIRWDSILDLGVVLYVTQNIVWEALARVVRAKGIETSIAGYVNSIRDALNERTRQLEAPTLNLQVQASISPTLGLGVRDLWASHTTKRAWAVRGANLECRSGEVLLILGDEGSGRSRLLTTLSEAVLSPHRGASTVSRINRGSISLGGLDISKWDGNSLRRRAGVVLNDVRTCSDMAMVLSGLTMEEILDPTDGFGNLDPSHSPSQLERQSITKALQITGLSSSLLPRLPSKMTTVVTANEEDLKPSPFRARSTLLSPVEWSKLLLARVLSQTIFDNESTASGDKFDNCLMGSLLLLDDVTGNLSETDEARLLKNLRQTGAAVVVTSNRWAAGRWADRIVVMKGGAVVESGTHAELLNRGAQSLYASSWHAMTSMG
jgi:ABC-type multidrug transport system fused ATPase/permease subunit